MRAGNLGEFLDAVEAALQVASGPAAKVAKTAVARWRALEGVAAPGAERLPVCEWIGPALQANGGPLAQSFAAIERELRWYRRSSATPDNVAYWNGHANAMVLGPGGLEERSDLWLGVTVMAPGTLYDNHTHPPAEVYLPLSPGEWWNAEMEWNDPGLAGFIYNPPGILHAMRAGDKPFLALWVLPN